MKNEEDPATDSSPTGSVAVGDGSSSTDIFKDILENCRDLIERV
jgi:hypothetical protein